MKIYKEKKNDVKRIKRAQSVRNTISTMAIENMFLDKDYLNNFQEFINGTKTTDDIRKELDKKYGR